MLSRVLLWFDDNDMQNKYSREKGEFYKKVIPIIAAMMLALSVTLEVVYRVYHNG